MFIFYFVENKLTKKERSIIVFIAKSDPIVYATPSIHASPSLLTADNELTYYTKTAEDLLNVLRNIKHIDPSTTPLYVPDASVVTLPFNQWLVDIEGFFLLNPMEVIEEIYNLSAPFIDFYYENVNNIKEPLKINNARRLHNLVKTVISIKELERSL
jgi:hypothetical protein